MGTIIFLIILVLLWQGGFWLTVDVLEVFKSYSVPSPAGVGLMAVTRTSLPSRFSVSLRML